MPQPADPSNYTVVARRYRPQRFEDVVGQDHVVESLRNAIRLNRVTHAYLFSGTRGVGKTSIARIFAKCLNCVKGPTDQPCLECDICQAIATGEDVDVLEIDGASNNGVESVRELRQNTGLRPSRARFKIYYIDEVHMLSTGAFNALLKTLEEPPPHVKFFFATTEPGKIPVTVLSRCQRYDFAGMTPEQIVTTLGEICRRESIEAEPEALQTIARRAGGSMRDAQSLVEQLLSSAGERLTVDAVHRLLGTASDERILEVLESLTERDSASVLQKLHASASQGVQPSDLLSGVIDFLRDVMVLAAGAGDTMLTASPRQRPRLQAIVDRWPLDSILAALQILSETRTRLRGSPHSRTVIEVGLIKVARLENLTEIGDLIGRLSAMEAGLPPIEADASVKKKLAPPEDPAEHRVNPPSQAVRANFVGRSAEEAGRPGGGTSSETQAEVPPPRERAGTMLTLGEAATVWPRVVEAAGLKLGKGLSLAKPIAVSESGVLVIGVPSRYNWIMQECETDQARTRISQILLDLLGHSVPFQFELTQDAPSSHAPANKAGLAPHDAVSDDPMVRKVVELFEARPVLMEAEED